jgi:hypothetical protein
MQKPLTQLFANGSSGTTQYLAVALANGTVSTATTGELDSGLVVGVAYQGAGTSGNIQVATFGQTPWVCDNQTVVGDFVQLSSTTAGECHDAGATPILGELNPGTVYSPNTGAGTQSVILINFPGASGAVNNQPIVTPGYVSGVTQHAASYTLQPSDNNYEMALVGTTAAQTLTFPQPGTNGTTTYTGQFGQNLICSSATTCTTTTFNVTAGQSIVAWSNIDGGTAAGVTLSDTAGDTFAQIGTTLNPQTGYYMQMFWTKTSAGGVGLTVTSTTTSGSGNLELMAGAFANFTGLDQGNVGAGQVGGQSAAIQSPAVITTQPVEVLVGGVEQACGAPSTPVSGYSNITAGQFMYSQVGVAGSYVAGLASICNASARWAAQIATFFVNGSAPQYANGYTIWASNYSNQTWTLATTGSTLTNCAGTAASSTSLPAGQQWQIKSDGANYWANCGQGGSSGGSGVTNFSAGNLSPLFTSSVATATTTPALTFALSNAAAHSFFGNNTGSTTAPAYATIGTADLPFTYTTTNGATLLLTGSGTFTNGHCVAVGPNGNMVDNGGACGSGSGVGTVTSVALAMPGIFTVSGSPVTTTGTLTAALANESANLVFAGPASGGAAAPTFRALVSADIPNNAANTSGLAGTATALAATPTQCTGGQVATGIAASGNANCTSTGTGSVSGTGSVNSGAMFTASAVIASSPLTFSGSNTTGSGTGTFTGLVSNGAGLGLVTFTTTTTVSSLPSAGSNAGALAVVTDSTTITSANQVCVGSGSVTALAFSDGTNWYCSK